MPIPFFFLTGKPVMILHIIGADINIFRHLFLGFGGIVNMLGYFSVTVFDFFSIILIYY